MTLDDAIIHAEETADEIDNACEHYEIAGVNVGNGRRCAEDHRQLAEWLKELKSFREAKEDIQKTIDETRENGKYHAQFVQDNGELMIFGMEITLDIIKEHLSCSEFKKG